MNWQSSGSEMAREWNSQGVKWPGSETAGSQMAGSEIAGSEMARSEMAGSEMAREWNGRGVKWQGVKWQGVKWQGSETPGSEMAGSETAGVRPLEWSGGSKASGHPSLPLHAANLSINDISCHLKIRVLQPLIFSYFLKSAVMLFSWCLKMWLLCIQVCQAPCRHFL